MRYLIYLIALFFAAPCDSSRVLELSDRFLDVYPESHWFVMFYAPWCAYCKRTEPIWGHVAQNLYNTNIRTGRIDATRFPSVSKHFNVKYFPTILFMKDGRHYIYEGDRERDDLINFALRMQLPPVTEIIKSESIKNLRQEHEVFFLHVGEPNNLVWQTYYHLAELFQPHVAFFTTKLLVADKAKITVDTTPAIFVLREGTQYPFAMPDIFELTDLENNLNASLHRWINEERFPLFPKVTKYNINQLMHTRKYLVLAVVAENKLGEIETEEIEFRSMVENVIIAHRNEYHKNFQFGWIGNPDMAHSIVMDTLPTPHLLVLNTTTHHHYIPDDDPMQLTPDAINTFLDNLLRESVTVYGGDTYFIRLYRALFELRRSLNQMWLGNPVLTSVLFGLPLGFLALILYSIFCADILDAPDDDDDDDDGHEKKE